MHSPSNYHSPCVPVDGFCRKKVSARNRPLSYPHMQGICHFLLIYHLFPHHITDWHINNPGIQTVHKYNCFLFKALQRINKCIHNIHLPHTTISKLLYTFTYLSFTTKQTSSLPIFTLINPFLNGWHKITSSTTFYILSLSSFLPLSWAGLPTTGAPGVLVQLLDRALPTGVL